MYFIPVHWPSQFSSVYSDPLSVRDTVETILFPSFSFSSSSLFFFSSRIASNFTAATKWQNLGRETRTQRVPFTRPKWTKACHGREVSGGEKKSFQGGRIRFLRCHVFTFFFFFFFLRNSTDVDRRIDSKRVFSTRTKGYRSTIFLTFSRRRIFPSFDLRF